MLVVKSKDGQVVRCELHKYQYTGTFMGERSIMASFSSPTPISFGLFDYVEYRGERFELDYNPSDSKNARKDSRSDAFVYDLKFVSLKYELERCLFRDLVPNDNGIVYPTPLRIEFTGTVDKLAERIQACLNSLYPNQWHITVASGVKSPEKNISVSNSNCWQALSLAYTEYGISYYISGRNITIGGEEPAISTIFEYGKGKGLYKIERNAENDKGIVTRLRVYGSERNIGPEYLKNKNIWPSSIVPGQYLPNLMLPGYEKTLIDYIDSDKKDIYGIREASIVYDDIYPSIRETTNSKGERIDQIASSEVVIESTETKSTFWITTHDFEFEKPFEDYMLEGETATISIRTGPLQGYGFEINSVEKLSGGGYKFILNKNTDNGNTVPNKGLNLSANTEFVLLGIEMPIAYIENAENRLLERGREYLALYDHTNYGYIIGIDEIFAANNSSLYSSIYEGKRLIVKDDDLGINNESIIIQTLTIKEGDSLIPTYEVTLNNEPSSSTINRIQGQVSQLESTVTNNFTLLKWQNEQYYRRYQKPSSLWTLDKSTEYLTVDQSGENASFIGNILAKGDIIASAIDSDIPDIPFPVAGYDMAGIVRIKPGSGLIVREGVLEVDPSFAGGLDEEQLKLYLTNNKYVTEEHLKTAGYIILTSPLAGYKIAEKYAPITTTDTILTAFGKLEKNFSNYVDLTTDQLIKGKKTFEETIFSKKDIIASAIDTSVEDVSFPIASATRLGCVKVGANLSITTDGVLSALETGGIAFTPGTALQLTSNDVLNVVFGTTGTTACAGNDSRLSNARPNPYALTFTGFSTGTYTGASSLTIAIPTNNSQLSNGRGYITGITKSMILGALSGSGSSSKYLAGDGTFYTISYGEISGTPTLNYLPLTGGTLTGNLAIRNSGPILYFYNSADTGLYWSIRYLGTSDLAFYRQNTKTAWLTPAGDFVTSGDIVASATSSSISDIMAVASSSTYGLVKYDNSTIRVNSSGQLYCTISGGGGEANISWATDTGNTVYLSVNGVSKRLTLADGFAVTNTTSSQYRTIKIVGASNNLSIYGHTHTWSEVTGKPSWIGSSKPSYSWSEISSKPSVISSITYSISGSGNVVTNVTASGNKVSVTKGSISSGGSWNGGTVTNNITISRTSPTLVLTGSGNWFIFHNTSQSNSLCFQRESLILYKMQTSGILWVYKSVSEGSDDRIKTRYDNVQNILPKIMGIDVFRYVLNEDKEKSMQIGVSAQRVQQLFPELVSLNGDRLGVAYNRIGVIALQGIKELYSKHQKLESDLKSFAHWKTTKDQQIDFLMKENSLLKARVNELERGVA